jgi:hypothetical protein
MLNFAEPGKVCLVFVKYLQLNYFYNYLKTFFVMAIRNLRGWAAFELIEFVYQLYINLGQNRIQLSTFTAYPSNITRRTLVNSFGEEINGH